MPRRLVLALLAGMCLLALTGCDPTCTRGLFCAESADNPLNDAPRADFGGGMTINGRDVPLTAVRQGGSLDFAAHYSDPDGDALYYEWDLDGDGDFDRAGYGREARFVYRQVGTIQITLRVSDFPRYLGAPGVVTERRTVVVVDPARNHAPRAGFTIFPEDDIGQPRYFVGQPVFLDGSPSSDPDGYDAGQLRFSFEAHQLDGSDSGVTTLSGTGRTPRWAMRFDRPGRWVIKLTVTDVSGATDVRERQITVHENTPFPNQPPHAAFTISRQYPFVGEEVELDASTSSDPDDFIHRYEWDLDGDGTFEIDRGAEAKFTTRFESAGSRRIGLRVWDGFLFDVTYREIQVILGDEGPVSPGAQAAAARTPGQPFSARLTGRPLPGGWGALRTRGRRTLVDVLGRGRMKARVLAPSGRPSRGLRDLRRFLAAPWRTRARFVFERRSKRLAATAIALASVRGGSACLRVRLESRPGSAPRGRLTVIGGSGAGARLRASATFRFRLERDGSATVLGHVRAQSGRPRGVPAACRRLATR